MATTIRLTFRNMEPSPAVDFEVRQRAEKLAAHFPDLMDCHAVIEVPHRSQQKGVHFRMLLELKVPGKTLVVSRDPAADATREDAHITIYEAFRAAHRALEHYIDERRGEVKRHQTT
jgi:ribosome-associated translation inhibitor RaiA